MNHKYTDEEKQAIITRLQHNGNYVVRHNERSSINVIILLF